MYDFNIRAYGKGELALLYFPTASTSHSAVNHLMAWINRCTPLRDRLTDMGYRKTDKFFSPRQVAEIVEHLGEP